jgi:hypothetical protein
LERNRAVTEQDLSRKRREVEMAIFLVQPVIFKRPEVSALCAGFRLIAPIGNMVEVTDGVGGIMLKTDSDFANVIFKDHTGSAVMKRQILMGNDSEIRTMCRIAFARDGEHNVDVFVGATAETLATHVLTVKFRVTGCDGRRLDRSLLKLELDAARALKPAELGVSELDDWLETHPKATEADCRAKTRAFQESGLKIPFRDRDEERQVLQPFGQARCAELRRQFRMDREGVLAIDSQRGERRIPAAVGDISDADTANKQHGEQTARRTSR